MPLSDDSLVELLHETALAVRTALDGLDDWGPTGTVPGQYLSDLTADAAAIGVLDEAGVGVLSEESGLHSVDRELMVVLDPLDGSTNASRGVPWFASSLCAVAEGTLDGFVDCSPSAHGPWDYLGGALVCTEAGGMVADARGRDLVVIDHAARRTPVAAATPELLDALLAARPQHADEVTAT